MDVSTATFEREVLEASRTCPVVVDFWAPWCGPCRVLGPVLDSATQAFAGHIKLVKINVDENRELSEAFDIRSIPNVIAFKDGRPVARFTGALPEARVLEFFSTLAPPPGAAALRAVEAALAAGNAAEAEILLAQVPRHPGLDDRIVALERGISLAKACADGPNEAKLREALDIDPLDHAARMQLANVLAGQRRYRAAMEELLEVIRLARYAQSSAAREQLSLLFTLAASADPALVAEYRRKLETALA